VAQGRLLPLDHLRLRHALALAKGEPEADGLWAQVDAEAWASSTSRGALLNLIVDSVPVLARFGKTEAALEVLRESVAAGTVPPYDWLLLNPHLAVLRSDARFRAVLESAKRQFDEMLAGLEEARGRGELPAYLAASLPELKRRVREAAASIPGR